MKTFCAILLMGIVAYVQADVHECDPFAVNVEDAGGAAREGHDATNQKLALKDFLKNQKVVLQVTHTSPNNLPAANEFCSAPTHGSECAGVEYFRKLKPGQNTTGPKYLEGIEFELIFIGYDLKDNTSIEYKMTVAGSNADDFIFKWVKDTPITAHKLENNDVKSKIPIVIHPDILKIFQSEFAMYSFKVGGYALYVTCDATHAWVLYDKTAAYPPQDESDLMESINKLKALAKEKKSVDLKIEPINRQFPPNLSAYLTQLAV